MNALRSARCTRWRGQEARRDPVAPRGRKVEVDALAQERVGHLHEDPSAVAGRRVGPGRAAVLEVS